MLKNRVPLAFAAPFACVLFHCGLVAPGPTTDPAPAAAATLIVAPDDGTAAILAALRAARRRVWMEMYLLTSPDAVDALVAAQAAGRDVRVLLEPAPYGSEAANQSAFSTLSDAGVDVRWFSVPGGLVHAKLVLIDDAAYVLTMNLTSAGLTTNREYAVIDPAPDDLHRAEAIWIADALGGDPGATPTGVQLLASPIDARSRLAAAIDAARVSLMLEIEELSDSDLVARLIAAHGRGVDVSIVVPAADRPPAMNSALATMASAGVPIRALGAPTVHAKAMAIDQRTVYVGSVNFTRASLDDNREIGLLLDAPTMAARVGATIGSDAVHGSAP